MDSGGHLNPGSSIAGLNPGAGRVPGKHPNFDSNFNRESQISNELEVSTHIGTGGSPWQGWGHDGAASSGSYMDSSAAAESEDRFDTWIAPILKTFGFNMDLD